jgi:hypothetical protein
MSKFVSFLENCSPRFILLKNALTSLSLERETLEAFNEMTKITVINLISPVGNTNQRMGVHGPLHIISEVESGAMEE